MAPYIFTATWTTREVEHLLVFSTYGNPKQFFVADFGILDRAAQEFAIACVEPFMPPAFAEVSKEQENFCFLRYSLGRLAGWGILSSLDLEKLKVQEFETQLSYAVRQRLFPTIANVRDRSALLEFLQTQSDVLANFRINLAMQMCFMAFLRRELDEPLAAIDEKLRTEAKRHELWLKGQDINPHALVEHIRDQLNSLH